MRGDVRIHKTSSVPACLPGIREIGCLCHVPEITMTTIWIDPPVTGLEKLSHVKEATIMKNFPYPFAHLCLPDMQSIRFVEWFWLDYFWWWAGVSIYTLVWEKLLSFIGYYINSDGCEVGSPRWEVERVMMGIELCWLLAVHNVCIMTRHNL